MAARIAFALVACLAAASCGRSAAPPRTVPDDGELTGRQRSAYLRALREQAAGDDAAADGALEPLLALRPLHVPSHLLHQDLAHRAAGPGAAREEYEALARELEGDGVAEMLRARAAGESLESRIAGYQAAAVRDPGAPWPRIALASARSELARELQRRADARARLGFADEARKLREEAKASADRARTEGDRAAALAPRLAPARAAQGHALATAAVLAAADDKERRALRSQALDALGEALRLDPGDPRVLLDRAFVLRETKGPAEAQKDLDAAAAAAPKDAGILAARARNLEEQGPTLQSEAVEAWEAVAAAAPLDPDVAVDLGSACARASRWAKALAAYRRADSLYESAGGARWRARRGLVTALAQAGIDSRDPALLAEALVHLRAYREEGGLDAEWAGRMAELLGEEPAAPEK